LGISVQDDKLTSTFFIFCFPIPPLADIGVYFFKYIYP